MAGLKLLPSAPTFPPRMEAAQAAERRAARTVLPAHVRIHPRCDAKAAPADSVTGSTGG